VASPLIRALNVRRALAEVSVLSQAQQTKVRASMSPASLHTLETTKDVGWVDLAISAELNEALYAVMSVADYRRWSRQMASHVLKRSMVSGMVETALRLFGVTPQGVLKMAPRGWEATYREAGTVHVAALTPTSARITLTHLPAMMHTPSYLETIAGGLETVFDLCKVTGRIDIERQTAGDTVQMVASWV